MNEEERAAFQKSIMELAQGAFQERADYEMGRIVQNILDVNTSATAKRKMTVTLEFKPNEDRNRVGVACSVKSVLAPTNPVTTMLYITDADNITEMVPQVVGQIDMNGEVQAAPPQLRVIKAG